MHAYAVEDPVFAAINAKGQSETDGALGSFCIGCHAPLAVSEGVTEDGLDLDVIPKPLRGVTCAYCHRVRSVSEDHNAGLVISDDLVMRGGLDDPVPTGAHDSQYSALLDRTQVGSSLMCGACHEVVTPAGVRLERTYTEWKESLFADPDRRVGLSCGRCHMNGRNDLAALEPALRTRRAHDHSMPGVDVALTPFPNAEVQRDLVQRELDATLAVGVCVDRALNAAVVSLDNVTAGHGFPSGVSQHRRAWVEVVARRDGEVVFETGAVDDGEPVVGRDDPRLWLLRDEMLDEDGAPVDDAWEAVEIASTQLPAAKSLDRSEHVVRRIYPLPTPLPDEITARVRIRPVGLDVLDGLIKDDWLGAEVRDAMPTFNLDAAKVTWTDGLAGDCAP